jgi:hypothetical protein
MSTEILLADYDDQYIEIELDDSYLDASTYRVKTIYIPKWKKAYYRAKECCTIL